MSRYSIIVYVRSKWMDHLADECIQIYCLLSKSSALARVRLVQASFINLSTRDPSTQDTRHRSYFFFFILNETSLNTFVWIERHSLHFTLLNIRMIEWISVCGLSMDGLARNTLINKSWHWHIRIRLCQWIDCKPSDVSICVVLTQMFGVAANSPNTLPMHTSFDLHFDCALVLRLNRIRHQFQKTTMTYVTLRCRIVNFVNQKHLSI